MTAHPFGAMLYSRGGVALVAGRFPPDVGQEVPTPPQQRPPVATFVTLEPVWRELHTVDVIYMHNPARRWRERDEILVHQMMALADEWQESRERRGLGMVCPIHAPDDRRGELCFPCALIGCREREAEP